MDIRKAKVNFPSAWKDDSENEDIELGSEDSWSDEEEDFLCVVCCIRSRFREKKITWQDWSNGEFKSICKFCAKNKIKILK